MKSREIAADIIFYSGLYLILTLLSVLLFNSLMFISFITIKPLFLPISMFLAACLYFYLLRRKNIHYCVYGLILALALFVVVAFVCGYVFDLSYDGNWYHKATVGSLTYGWNPVYESLADFASEINGVNIGNLADSAVWADHYCKAAWIFGSGLHSITGNIECAKAINPIFAYILFTLVFRYLIHRSFSVAVSVITALITALNPISIPQMFTFYNDGLLASALFCVIVLLVGFADDEYTLDKEVRAVMLFCVLVFLINIKFTGLAYAGFFCLSFFILRMIRAVIKKEFRRVFPKAAAFYVVTLATALIFVGSSSYVKNTIDHGHPLYPLFGEDKIDIMTKNQPNEFSDMTNPEKLYNSLFSQTSNPIGDMKLIHKKPFTVDPYELIISGSSPDTRIGGMGVFFSGILVVSLAALAIILVYLAIRHRNGFFIALVLIIPSLCLLFIISESWWARYSPYLWLLPIAVIALLIYIAKEMRIYAKLPIGLLAIFLTVTCISNNAICTLYPISSFNRSDNIRRELIHLSYISKDKQVAVRFPNYAFYGIEYNLKDYDINYNVVAELENATAFYDGRAEAEYMTVIADNQSFRNTEIIGVMK